MKVVLKKDVRGIGKKNDIVEVSDGHGRNYLLAKGLADPATSGVVARVVSEKAKIAELEAEKIKKLSEIKRVLESRFIEFFVKTDKDGNVFGSVSKDMIQKAIREHHFITAERVDVVLDHPIKQIGDHSVVVDLKHGISAKLKVLVRQQQ